MIILVFCSSLLNNIPLNASSVLFETKEPLDGWLDCELRKGSFTIEGEGNFQLSLYPVNYSDRPHRYKWNPASWSIGQPNLRVEILIPKGVKFIEGSEKFSCLGVEHGKEKPTSWITYKHSPSSKKAKAPPEISEIISTLLSEGLSVPLKTILFIASASEAVANLDRYYSTLEKYSSTDFEKVTLNLPKPDVDFCAAKIVFGLSKEKELKNPIGILFKADKRTMLGQYESKYFLIEIPSEEEISKHERKNYKKTSEQTMSLDIWIKITACEQYLAEKYGVGSPGYNGETVNLFSGYNINVTEYNKYTQQLKKSGKYDSLLSEVEKRINIIKKQGGCN